eukprot:6275622-Alexandrium_andersonii.AAC.1
MFADSEPRRGPFGRSGELGPRAPGLDFGALGPSLTRGLNDGIGAEAYEGSECRSARLWARFGELCEGSGGVLGGHLGLSGRVPGGSG